MKKEKIIENGTEVLVFSKYGNPTMPKLKGIIVNSKDSGDLSQHGSPWSLQVYFVLGDDRITYFGTYGGSVIGDYYFRTKQNYIDYLNRLINGNNRAIIDLENKNKELRELMNINWFEEKEEAQEEKPKVYSKRNLYKKKKIS